MIGKIGSFLALAGLLVLAGCAPPDRALLVGSDAQIEELAQAVMALGPGIDPEEARRAARISYEYPQVLVQSYEIEDSAVVHNMKVNAGLKPRGLCWHWAYDMWTRLSAEEFQTLDINRAIAPDRGFHLEHNTAVITTKGGSTYDGLMVDPWRYAGVLFWSKLPDDKKYRWEDRTDFYLARPDRAAAIGFKASP